LNYANGPGSVFAEGVDLSDGRPAPENVLDKNYRQQALIPTGSETHGGQDVPVYASGPGAHLVSGVMEQNVIYHIMADARGL
jgi:alkaline phosphatase